MGWMGWKSLKALILRAPLCGANNNNTNKSTKNNKNEITTQITVKITIIIKRSSKALPFANDEHRPWIFN